MATVASNGMDPNDPNNQQPSTGGSGTVTNSTGGGAGTAGGGGAPAGAAPRANPSNTPNVQDYLNANQNAGQGLSNKIQSNVQNQANQVNTNLNTYQNQLNNSYQPLNTTTSQGQQTAQTAFQNPQALLAAYQAAQAQSQPGNTTAAPNQTDLSNYNGLQNEVAGTAANTTLNNQINQYGTTGGQDYGQLQSQLGTLGQQTSAAANPMGQNQLLQQAVGTPNYNMGQQSLDALFLQGQGNQLQQNLGKIQNQANNAVSGFQSNAAGTGYQNQLQALQNTAAGNVAGTQNLFNTGSWNPANAPSTSSPLGLNAIGANATAAATAANNAQSGILAPLQSAAAANNGMGVFNAAQLAQLGIAPGTNAYGVNLGQYINASPAATTAGVTDQNTLNRYNALNQIAGGPSGSLQPSIFGAGTTTGGTYNPINFDSSAFNTAVQDKQQSLTSNLGTDLNTFINSIPGTQSHGTGGSVGSSAQSDFFAPLQAQWAQNPNMSNQQKVQDLVAFAQANPTSLQNTNAKNLINFYQNQYSPETSDILGQNLTSTAAGGNLPMGPTNSSINPASFTNPTLRMS